MDGFHEMNFQLLGPFQFQAPVLRIQQLKLSNYFNAPFLEVVRDNFTLVV